MPSYIRYGTRLTNALVNGCDIPCGDQGTISLLGKVRFNDMTTMEREVQWPAQSDEVRVLAKTLPYRNLTSRSTDPEIF